MNSSKKRPAKKRVNIGTKSKCIIRGCHDPVKSRGLCDTCLTAAKREVKKGETTWEELYQRKLAIPPGERGRPKSAAFHRALKATKRKK